MANPLLQMLLQNSQPNYQGIQAPTAAPAISAFLNALMAKKLQAEEEQKSQSSMQALMQALRGPPQSYLPGAEDAGPPDPRKATSFGQPNQGNVMAAALGAVQSNPQIAGLLPALLGGKQQEGFTLGEGQVRFDSSGRQIAQGSEKKDKENLEIVTLKLPDGKERSYRKADPQVDKWLAEGATLMRTPGVQIDMGIKPPTGYRWKSSGDLEKIPGGPATQLSPEQAGKYASVLTAKKDVKASSDLLFDKDGKIKDRNLLVTAAFNAPNSVGRQYRTGMKRAIEALLRARTGSAAPASEVDNYMTMYMPSYFDDDATIEAKRKALDQFITDTASIVELGTSAIPDDEDVIDLTK